MYMIVQMMWKKFLGKSQIGVWMQNRLNSQKQNYRNGAASLFDEYTVAWWVMPYGEIDRSEYWLR